MDIPPFDRRATPSGAQVTRWQAPDRWELRCFSWPAERKPSRGAVLFQTGRGDVFEKYLETFDHWHRRGWSVTAFDWRGQGGSGRCSPAGDCGHVEDFAHFIRDLAGFFAEWRAAQPGPHVLIGHSMGGHLVLRALAERAVAPDAAVLVAPMLGLHSPLGLGGWLAPMLARLGDPARPAWRGNEKPYATDTRESLLTHDAGRYEDELWWQQQDVRLVTGPPSWRWVVEAFRSIRVLGSGRALEETRVPVLGLIAERDGLVDAWAALAMLARLPDAEVVRFGRESAHEILREADAVRNRALDAIDRFLDQRAPRG